MSIQSHPVLFVTSFMALLSLPLMACSQTIPVSSVSQSSINKSSTNASINKPSTTQMPVADRQIANLQKMTNYKLDPHHSNARFSINHMNTSTVTGGFYELTGDVKFSAKQQAGYAKIDIPIDTLHSVSTQFVEHLKGQDFFDIEKYPTATFESTQWYFDTKNPEKVTKIEGNLTMHGKTAPVTLTATRFNCYFHPVIKKTLCGGDFTTKIDRTQWNISKYVLMGITKDVWLDIEVEAIKQ